MVMPYTLHAEQALLEVVPERGGLITRWRWHEHELLYLDRERFAHPELSVRGGIPLLFPICGNLPDDLFHYGGRAYTLKQHGFARDMPWHVLDQQADRLCLGLSDSDATRQVYPFAFRLTLTYRLRANVLAISLEVANPADTPLPFSFGLHPYFAVTDKTQLSFDLPVHAMVDQKTQQPLTFAGTFDWGAAELDLACRPLQGQRAQVCDHQQQYCLTLRYDLAFTTLVFWTLQGKPYYCLEPWTAPRNALNTGVDLLQVPPQSHTTLGVEIAVAATNAPQ
ncbi:aldose epimerase family protein [Parathermosynechococcus lividus]